MSGDIKTVAVIGAGTMGAAIAQHFAMKNLPVILVDRDEAAARRGLAHIEKSLTEAVERRIVTPEAKAATLARLTPAGDPGAAAAVDLVVEAVFEDLQVKTALFARLETVLRPDALIGTNTSSFAVTELARGLRHPERLVGVHYFYHAAKNKLVELIPGERTGAGVVARLAEFYAYIDKVPVVVRDVPGFAVNRFFVPWLNEAARLYEEGLGSPALIDRTACEAFQIGMGPFALMNATGVPIALHAARNLERSFGAFYAPAPVLVEQAGRGAPWDLALPTRGGENAGVVRDRLLGAALGVAAQMVTEKVTDATATDLAARVGLRWQKGPFEMINDLGVEAARRLVASCFGKYDLPVPGILASAPAAGIRLEAVRTHLVKDVAVIEFNRPDSLNALNEATVAQLGEAVDQALASPAVSRLVLKGQGKAFVAGADVAFFVRNLDRKDVRRIREFTERGQAVLQKLATAAKPTVAYLDGLALGGGLELALACQYRIATDRARFAFPETGIGIYPGLGGTQRTPRLIGKGLAKYLVATGQMIDAATALKMGLVDQVVPRADGLKSVAALTATRGTPAGAPTGEAAAFEVYDGALDEATLSRPALAPYAKILSRKAPLALRKAMELIDRGSGLPVDAALALELKDLDWVFNTKDARTGLGSVLTRERVTFKGE